MRVNPRTKRDVGITLAGGRDCNTEGAVCAADGRTLSNTVSATVRSLPRLKVAGGRAREGTDEAIDFAVTLSRAASGTVTVDYATVDETAIAGTDYTATSGTLTLAPGETEKTVRVAILDDLLDEGREIFRLKLSNAVGARIADGKAAGRINNTDPGQAAWLSRFGRAVATGVVDALGDRIDRRAQVRSRSGSADLSLLHSFALSAVGGHGGAGYGMAGSGVTRFGAHFGGTGTGYPAGAAGPSNAMPGHHNGIGFGGDPMGGAFGGGALLGNSMPMGPVGAGADIALPTGSLYVPGSEDGRWTGWAQTSVGHFSGGPGAALALSGQMRMGIFGTDYQMGRLLAGVAVAHGRGAGNMMRAGLDRAYNAHSTLTSGASLRGLRPVGGPDGVGTGRLGPRGDGAGRILCARRRSGAGRCTPDRQRADDDGRGRPGRVAGGGRLPVGGQVRWRSWYGRSRTPWRLVVRATSRRPRRG